MKKAIIILGAILICVLFLVGCAGGSSRQRDTGDYRVGTQGLEISFKSNSPPSRVYAEDGTFPVALEVRNLGVFPGEGDGSLTADIYFRGFDTNIIQNLDQESVSFDEEDAKTRYNPEGGFEILQVDASIDPGYFQNTKIDSYDADLVAIACYPYRTYAAVDVCIDPNPNKKNVLLDVCTPGVYSSGSQGAPIAVTSVESIPQKGKARFTIRLSNVGGGDVLRESALGMCVDTDIDREELDKVTLVNAQLSNGIPLDCSGNDEIRLVDGQEATVVCKAEGLDESMPAFKTILLFELAYAYKKTAYRTVSILGE